MERNLKLLDLHMGDEEFIGFVFINDRSYGQGMNPPPLDFRGAREFWSCIFSGGQVYVNF